MEGIKEKNVGYGWGEREVEDKGGKNGMGREKERGEERKG